MDENFEKEVLECTMEVQRHMLLNMKADESYKILTKKYGLHVIKMAMDLLNASKFDDKSPYKAITETITRCMNKLDSANNMKLDSIDSFYKLCEVAYKIFMNDKDGRAMPIVFLYNKGIKTLGVAPITNVQDGKSPMDYLKQVVYSANPDAYCFCGEASMVKSDKKEDMRNYKYGDLAKDPRAEDVVIFQGNNKENTKRFNKALSISGEDGNLKFKVIEEFEGGNLESEKTP